MNFDFRYNNQITINKCTTVCLVQFDYSLIFSISGIPKRIESDMYMHFIYM